MSAAEVREGAEAREPGPETLALGPRPGDRPVARRLLVLLVVAALALGGWAGWQRLQPPPDLTLDQLHRAYAGLVRAGGTSAVSTLDPATFNHAPLTVDPATCRPLFATTVWDRFPDRGLDGVSAYWLSGSDSVSLFTVRYADPRAATTAYRQVADATAACEERPLRLSNHRGTGQLERVPLAASAEAREQLAYQLELTGRQGRYVLHLLRLQNTVSWQYRYQARSGRYEPAAAQELMETLAGQLRWVRGTRLRAPG